MNSFVPAQELKYTESFAGYQTVYFSFCGINIEKQTNI